MNQSTTMHNNLTRSFAYVEPTIISLLILISFIYLLNVARSIADRVLYAGLIGEILIGMIYAKPLSNILKVEWQQTILDFGYLGLLLVVFHGGLETRLDFLSVKSNLFLSSLIGLTGIITPIGFSMILCTYLFRYGLLESFSMGASLSATSLGTTFAILSSQNQYQLNKSRMGTILVGAALLDDISGLVMASVIEKLQYLDKQSNLPWLICKPILSSILMMIISTFISRFLLGRLWIKINLNKSYLKPYIDHLLLFGLIISSSATITIASYTGASTLIGAYCCGAMLRYFDDCRMKLDDIENNQILFTIVFQKYMKIIKEYIFEPFFFASIGFAVPFLDLWSEQQLYQGIVYSILMIIAKFVTGIWILIWTFISHRWKKQPIHSSTRAPIEIAMIEQVTTSNQQQQEEVIRKTKGVYPALIVGLSMVSRGEIGFLIANIAFSTNILTQKAFIVTIWAILLNTILGPIAVGLMVKFFGPKLNDGLWVD